MPLNNHAYSSYFSRRDTCLFVLRQSFGLHGKISISISISIFVLLGARLVRRAEMLAACLRMTPVYLASPVYQACPTSWNSCTELPWKIVLNLYGRLYRTIVLLYVRADLHGTLKARRCSRMALGVPRRREKAPPLASKREPRGLRQSRA